MIEVGEGIRSQLEVVSGRLFEIKCGENTAELYSVFTRKRFSEAVRISPPPSSSNHLMVQVCVPAPRHPHMGV